ncbi:RagB/SusD family nutrient uptake outer membrane protein [Niabella insulamsoli]|uniref:RagB/SusD family nutrient uptake outer membrane protein n=1 Tax=Niabella insulamsoli TaxID=3144874 RepID=UPI0031FD394A
MKKIKLKYYISIALISLFALGSCDVERYPELDITDDTYWKTETDLKLAANYFYTYLDGHNTEENWSDNSFGQSTNSIADGSRIVPSSTAEYNNPYTLIRATNKLLEQSVNLEGVISDAALKRYQAEARFFRAWGYFDLIQKFGNIQLILKTLNDESPELYEKAVDRSVIFDQIYTDLDFAAANLPKFANIPDADYGRIAYTTALGLKARAALFEGTRSKFHSYGDPNKHLTLARDAALQVINSGEHALYPTYLEAFRPEAEGKANKETMLVRQYGISYDNRVSTNTFARQIEQGQINPTRSLVDSYVMSDGLPIDKSPLYSTPTKSEDYFNNRDLRLHGTVMKRGDEYTATQPTFNTPSLAFNKPGFVFKKYFNKQDWTINAGIMDRFLMRYAEILLTYAEAVYELNGSISDADLNKSINLLRARAQVAPLTNALVTANGLNMRTEIRRERRVELAQEGFRYWDLIRWKTAEIELPKTVYGNYLFPAEFGTGTSVPVTSDNIIIVHDASRRAFDPNKDYLWPLPLTEIALSQGALTQNPGWE